MGARPLAIEADGDGRGARDPCKSLPLGRTPCSGRTRVSCKRCVRHPDCRGSAGAVAVNQSWLVGGLASAAFFPASLAVFADLAGFPAFLADVMTNLVDAFVPA